MHCREATHLISAALDRPLQLTERVRLSMHLASCIGCRNFSRQLRLMRQTAQRWRDDDDPS